jgi:hypothetical protein
MNAGFKTIVHKDNLAYECDTGENDNDKFYI